MHGAFGALLKVCLSSQSWLPQGDFNCPKIHSRQIRRRSFVFYVQLVHIASLSFCGFVAGGER